MSQISLPDYGGSHPLVSRIVKLRGRVRIVVGLFGTGFVITSLVASMFVLMIVDYLIHLPGWFRLICLLAWVGGCTYLAWQKLILPLTTRLTDQFLASRVEQQHEHLSDELISAVNFIHAQAGASNALAAKHIDLAAQRTASIRFEDAVDYRQANKSMVFAALTVLVVAIIAVASPSMARIAFSRWFSAAPLDWPVTTHVAFDWSAYGGQPPHVIPLGEKFLVRAKVDKGGQPRVYLWTRTDRREGDWQLMTYQKEQSTAEAKVYETTIEPDGKELILRVKAGDDSEEAPITIGMAPRPVITDVQATIHAPAYAKADGKPAPSITANLLSQVGRVTQGAQVAIRVKATKAFLSTPGGPQIELIDPNNGQQIPISMQRTAVSDKETEIAFTADKTIMGRLVMKDTDTFENRSGGTVTLEVVPDAPPSVVIAEPRRSVERTPDGFVDTTIQATDDWGFTHLKLRADKFDAKAGDPPVFEQELTWNELLVDNAVGSTTGKSVYKWDLAPLKLDPGTRLSFYAMVKDNYDLNGQDHDWVKSAPLYLQIRSAAEIQEALRKQLAELAERLRNLKGQQELNRAQTDAIKTLVDKTNLLSAEQKSQLAGLTQQQTQEAATANAIEQRSEQIGDDLRQNNMKETDLGKLAQKVSDGMKEVGQQNMPRAAADLSKSQEGSQPKQSADSMRNANTQQDQAIATMEELLKELATTGDFDTLRSMTAKLLEEQQKSNKAVAQLAPKVTGQDRAKLPKPLQDQEDKLAADQRDLSKRAADLLDRLEKAADANSSSDPASSESMKAAAAAGRQSNVPGSQSNAGDQLSQNQVNDAQNNQTSATQGIQKMMDELNKNDLRKLEQLAREIRALLEDVRKLKKDEETLNTDSLAAKEAANALLQKLGDRQGRLQQNTIIVQKKAQSTQRAGQAASFIGEAADAMKDAASALYSNKQPDSLKPETDAIASLQNAIEELEKIQKQVEPDAKKKQLAEFIRKYEAIQKDQTGIKDKTDGMEARRQKNPDKELDREDELALGTVVKDQVGLIDQINLLSKDEDLSQVDVIVWMNGQVVESMSAARGRVEKQQLGKAVAGAQQQAVDRLQLIIDALKDEQRKSEFTANGGGGGGGGKPPLVPPLQQLKLLKAMQVVVNTETKTVAEAIKSSSTDAERNEHQTDAEALGNKQGEIHDRADKLMRRLMGGR